MVTRAGLPGMTLGYGAHLKTLNNLGLSVFIAG